MDIARLTFDSNAESQASINDFVYYCSIQAVGGFKTQLDESNIKKLGKILSMSNNSITVELTEGNLLPLANDFIFTSKDEEVSVSSLLGHFAEVKMKNTSTDKAELFRITLGFSESSK